jgi:predicted nucleic acid-binding protein
MTVPDSVFLDTSPIIYLIENNPSFYSKISSYLAESIRKDIFIITSVISIAEFGVQPKKINNLELIAEMEQMLSVLQVKVLDITIAMADVSSTLRAKYPSLKSSDALQLASAISSDCNSFVTNDKRLKIVTEINVLTVDELP